MFFVVVALFALNNKGTSKSTCIWALDKGAEKGGVRLHRLALKLKPISIRSEKVLDLPGRQTRMRDWNVLEAIRPLTPLGVPSIYKTRHPHHFYHWYLKLYNVRYSIFVFNLSCFCY